MPPARSSRVCGHLALVFKPASPPALNPNRPARPAACGSGLAGDSGHVTSYTAARLTEHAHTTRSGVSFTALAVIIAFTDPEN